MAVTLMVKCGKEGAVTHVVSSFSPQDSVVLHGATADMLAWRGAKVYWSHPF